MAFAELNDTVVLAGVVTSILLLVTFAFLKDSIATPRTKEKSNMSTVPVMSPPRADLLPPKDHPFTLAQLTAYDGSDAGKPIYVAIKGTVFDVSAKREMYGPGAGYHVFAGKDGSKGLGLSSLKPEDAVPDWSGLDQAAVNVLNQWYDFFSKRYNIVGKVTDLPESVRRS